MEDVVVENTYNHPPELVWNALTRHDEMIQWYFENLPAFEPVSGFETRFPVQSEEREFLHHWTILEVDPPRFISYEWRYDNYPGESVVRFELIPTNTGTRVRVSCSGLGSFPSGIPEFKPESCRQGWEYFMGGRLRDYLNKKYPATGE